MSVCVSSLFLWSDFELRPRMVLERPRTYKKLIPKKDPKKKINLLSSL